MIGRKEELEQLENMYCSKQFEFLIMYGRRRVGKTTILQEFSLKHSSNTLFFSAQEKNDALNLEDFSKLVQIHYNGQFISDFPSWENALDYLTNKSGTQKTIVIIDEFPFLAEANPAIKSILQHLIDHQWSERNFMLILCGSSVSFMVNEVMGYKSPLYGRMTASMEVLPFDYLDAAQFFPNFSIEQQLLAFGILGGIPRYLNAFSDEKSIKENIQDAILIIKVFNQSVQRELLLLRQFLKGRWILNILL